MRYGIWVIIIFVVLSCKKDSLRADDAPISPTTGTRAEFTLDSIYLYAREVYLWNDALPSYADFNPRKYVSLGNEFTAFKQELFDLSQIKTNVGTGKPYELPFYAGHAKYSFMEKSGASAGKIAATVTGNETFLKTALFSVGSANVAYLSLGSFPALKDSRTALDQAFAGLASANPRHMVIDLRSNAGGYVETAAYIANLLAPANLNGKVMYTEQYNTLLQSGKSKLLKHQPYLDENGKPVLYQGRNATMADVDYTEAGNTYRFSKKGTMTGITDVYFIVSGTTASASEMLISVLKPYFKVKVAGSQTYGKPVGFFVVKVDVYRIYFAGFLIRNAEGWSDYFNGISPDIPVQADDNALPGDPQEACLKAVLADIGAGPVTIKYQ